MLKHEIEKEKKKKVMGLKTDVGDQSVKCAISI
jgi:hypothetical protein